MSADQATDCFKVVNSSPRFALLDPLRGIAALWVVFYHYQFSTAFQEQVPFVHALTRNGEMGVAMFFVISGYCLTASARSGLRRSEGVGSFLYRRARRIYPPFWCSIAFVAAIPFIIEFLSSLKTGTYVPPSAENPNYGYLTYGFWDWLRLCTLTQAFHPIGTNISDKFTSINAVYWSLAIEEQFYLVMALALICARRFYLALIAVTLAAIPFSFFPGAYRNGVFLPWWLMFSFGVALYFAIEHGWRPERLFGRWALPVAAAVSAVGVAGYWLYIANGGHAVHHWFAMFFAVGLWFAVVFDQPFNRAKQHRWRAIRWATAALVLLGTMSYSLYLIHGRLQFLVIHAVRQVVEPDTIAFDVMVISFVVTACYPFYRWCEAPFFKPRVDPPEAKPAVAVAESAGSLGTSMDVAMAVTDK